jgi:hypothetical protein
MDSISSEVLLPHVFNAAGLNINARLNVWLTTGRNNGRGRRHAQRHIDARPDPLAWSRKKTFVLVASSGYVTTRLIARDGRGHTPGSASRMRVMILSGAWFPQTNAVVSTLAQTAACLFRSGDEVRMVTPHGFCSMPCPTSPEIRVALFAYRKMARRIAALAPQALHIATEGPLGFAARSYCIRHGLRFKGAYHTHNCTRQFESHLVACRAHTNQRAPRACAIVARDAR